MSAAWGYCILRGLWLNINECSIWKSWGLCSEDDCLATLLAMALSQSVSLFTWKCSGQIDATFSSSDFALTWRSCSAIPLQSKRLVDPQEVWTVITCRFYFIMEFTFPPRSLYATSYNSWCVIWSQMARYSWSRIMVSVLNSLLLKAVDVAKAWTQLNDNQLQIKPRGWVEPCTLVDEACNLVDKVNHVLRCLFHVWASWCFIVVPLWYVVFYFLHGISVHMVIFCK